MPWDNLHAFYEAERALELAESERRARVAACPGHSVDHESADLGYSHGVAVPPYTEENRVAHGGAHYRQTCRCGAVRDVLSNAGATERSPWR